MGKEVREMRERERASEEEKGGKLFSRAEDDEDLGEDRRAISTVLTLVMKIFISLPPMTSLFDISAEIPIKKQ